MFGIVDLVVVTGIKDALSFLSNNPRHIEFILGQFCQKPIRNLVGREHIKECIDYIQHNRIEVNPYYQMDIKKRPAISVVASYAEAQQFMGDYGSFQMSPDELPLIKYASFDAKSINKCKLYVSPLLKLEDKLWHGLTITNGQEERIIKGILAREGEDTAIFLDEALPEGTLLIGWKVVSGTKNIGYQVNSSMEAVTVQLKLNTLGDYSVHRLLATIVRYCLKKQRLYFDQYGLQVATYSQTPPLLTDENENEFETVFTIEGKMTDSWIDREIEMLESGMNIQIEIIADANDEIPTNEDVLLTGEEEEL